MFVEMVASTMLGVMWWIVFRYYHTFALNQEQSKHGRVFRAPTWLRIVCGNPLPDDQLELSLTLGQISALLLGISPMAMAWFGLDHSQRVGLISGAYLGSVIMVLVVRVIVMLGNRLE
jgi:hypothetical protein